MANNAPIAFLITWSPYGTRLHGDIRGSHDGGTNDRNGSFVPPSFRYENLRRHQLTENPLYLSPELRMIVRAAVIQHAAFRNWHLYAHNIRTNHVHIVVANGAAPSELLRQFKAYATRALREANLIPNRKKVWAAKGSKRWLFTRDHVDYACDYVSNRQGPDI